MLNPQDHLFEIIGANHNPESIGVKEVSQIGVLRKLRIKRFPFVAATVLLLIILGVFSAACLQEKTHSEWS